MTRKIIQIAAAGVENTQSTQSSLAVVALCDDGSVWLTSEKEAHPWQWLGAIPQDEVGPSSQESKP